MSSKQQAEDSIQILDKRISRDKLKEVAEQRFGDLVKAVVDISKRIMAIGGELHADEESILLEQGSEQKALWGINLYPDVQGDGFIEFDSMINVRPSQNNRSRSVEDEQNRKKIIEIVKEFIE